MSNDKTGEPQDSQNPLEGSPLKEQTESLQETSNRDRFPDENPEVLTTIDITELDPSNFNWLREANKKTPRDLDENTDI